jgi:hypothetical protein
VAIEHEDALIVWDPGKGMEHFIRRARFDTTAKDFGFLVPTPSKPELAEVPDSLFDRHAALRWRGRHASHGFCPRGECPGAEAGGRPGRRGAGGNRYGSAARVASAE